MTYNDYLIKLTNTMQVRATNFRLSQNEVTLLANNVYEEIALECALDFIQQEVTIEKVIDTYDIEALYVPVANEIAMNVVSIYDENGNNVTHYFRELGISKFKVNIYQNEDTNQNFLDENDGKIITFNRKVVPDIETLSARLQMVIFNTMLQGMMFYTQDAIPNPTGDQSAMSETNLYYQRYFKARQNLVKLLPQRI